MSDDARSRDLAALHQEILCCTRCVAAGYLADAHPVFRGAPGQRAMLIGQAPGPRANERGLPWAGASGTLLRSWFARAGFEPARFLDDWYLTSLTKCFPGKATGGTGDRVPSRAELALCRPFLEAEIALLQPALIVTLGRVAANAIIPGAKSRTLKELVGTLSEADLGYGPVPVIPLPHPSGVARWLNDPANRALVDLAMDSLDRLRTSLPLSVTPRNEESPGEAGTHQATIPPAAGERSSPRVEGRSGGVVSQARNDESGDGVSMPGRLK